MKIAIEGCLHGEFQKVYETIHEIEVRVQVHYNFENVVLNTYYDYVQPFAKI